MADETTREWVTRAIATEDGTDIITGAIEALIRAHDHLSADHREAVEERDQFLDEAQSYKREAEKYRQEAQGWEQRARSAEFERVPASQLRGAVEALGELAAAVRSEGAEPDRAVALMRALTKADTITGGQTNGQ